MEVTEKQIEEWKAKYKDIYKIDVLGVSYIYRGLSRAEQKEIKKLVDQNKPNAQEWYDEEIVRRCVLSPVIDTEAGVSGLIDTLADKIMVASGYIPDSAPEKL